MEFKLADLLEAVAGAVAGHRWASSITTADATRTDTATEDGS